jgi:hypothetical protein
MKSLAKPVIVGLSGGLGNQLFQFAAGQALSLKLGTNLILDTSWFYGHFDRLYALEPFSVEAQVHSPTNFLPNWVNGLESRFTRRWKSKRLGVPIYREPNFEFDHGYTLINEPVYLEGFWQSERYFSKYHEIIRSELALKDSFPENFQWINSQIKSTDSICVHIRRGDYASNPVAFETHGLCSVDYLCYGVQTVALGLSNPHCFIFSDDLEWVRKNLVLNLPCTIVDLARPHEAHLDLVLMSKCKHFVIANSSFSWWGAWLSPYSLKRVVAPKKWFVKNDKNTIDLIPQGWIRL